MERQPLKQILTLIEQLSARQRRAVSARLAALDQGPEAIEVIEQHQSEQPCCPLCGDKHVVRNGYADRLQRYLCRGCGRTFNALTGTPLAHLHQRDKWLQQAQALDEALTLSQAQERLNVARTTALRWRHRFLAAPKEVRAQLLTGVAEADETYFLRSAKGQRAGLARKARKRGSKAKKRGLSAEQVPVLVVRDRSGQTADFILQVGDSAHAAQKLAPIMARDIIFCTEGDPVMQATAGKLGVEHHAVNVAAGRRVEGPWHVQNVNSYHSRLKGWMRKFKGVSTKYLDSYLGWFRTVDCSPEALHKPASFLTLAMGN